MELPGWQIPIEKNYRSLVIPLIAGLSGKMEEDSNEECKRVEHIAYIKTYKTASSTVTNLLFRQALRLNKTVLIFNEHLQTETEQMYPIHLHTLFKVTITCLLSDIMQIRSNLNMLNRNT